MYNERMHYWNFILLNFKIIKSERRMNFRGDK